MYACDEAARIVVDVAAAQYREILRLSVRDLI
jgi:hypothetical protein